MNPTQTISPSHKYISYAETINRKNGHENLGFLSLDKGFMPVFTPLKSLPFPFSKWDDIAAQMPHHYKNQSLRKAIAKLPLLEPTIESLEDKYLCRASMLLSILAHAYVRNERDEDLNIPESILVPWKIVSDRLKRPQPFLSYIDLIMYNWKQKNTGGSLELENLQLLTPTVNNQEENVFYLTQTEIAFKTKEVVGFVVEIQDGIVNNQKERVIKGLQLLKKIVAKVTDSSFLKINPNPRSATYVDPVVWAKTVAPFAVPLKEGVQGPSGTSSPFFHLIDTFIERSRYDTILGKEALFIREWYPEHWRNFIKAVSEISILDYIEKCNDEALDGSFYDFVEAYSGDKGFLGVHRRKVYGYLQMAFKVGRSVTIGGFSGLFKERTWEEVDDELETTRLERYTNKNLKCPYSGVVGKSIIGDSIAQKIVLDVKDKGVTYQPGDRCAIVPKNAKEEVKKIIEILALSGEETIVLTEQWQAYFKKFYNETLENVTVYRLLSSAKLNDATKTLEFCSHIKDLVQLDNRGLVSLEAIVVQMQRLNMDAKQFLLPYLSIILQPEQERMYSISSGFEEEKIELTVGNATTKVKNKEYKGVASSYLNLEEVDSNSKIPFKIISPLRFSLPKSINTPIFLFAGGSGIAPFKGFWEALERKQELSNLSIFYSVKKESDIAFKSDLERILIKGKVNLNIIITREAKQLDQRASIINGKLVFKNTKASKIKNLLLEDNNIRVIFNGIQTEEDHNQKGYFYSCGKAGFALNVLESLKEIINCFIHNPEDSKEIFYNLFAENRLMQDIFTSPEACSSESKEFYLSDVISHNTPKNGYWVALENKVYDLTEFKEIHPGGNKIVEDNAGRDATHEFRRANHHTSKEILSMLTMYYIGKLKTINFQSDVLQVQYDDWVTALHLFTEMKNTFIADFSFKNKKTTLLCGEKEITPYKIALLVENQHRFLEEYVKNLKQAFKDLFYNSNHYNKVLQEFNQCIRTDINLNLENVIYEESEFKFRWEELVNLEHKNSLILELSRKMLWEGVKIFEAHFVNQSIQFEEAMEVIVNNFYKELEIINQEETLLVSVR